MAPKVNAGAWISAAALALVLLFAGLQLVGGSASAGRNDRTAERKPVAGETVRTLGTARDRTSPTPVRVTPNLPAAGPTGPDKVVAGVYVSNIQQVDLTTNSFDADFYVWLRWSNPDIDPTAGIEIMNVYQGWALTTTPVYDKPQRQSDGSLLWLARYQGSFNAPLSLADYPFQKQTLKIVIEDGEKNTGRIVYEPDNDPVGLDPHITLTGYNLGQPRIEFGANTYESSFGEVGATREDRTYTRIVVKIPVSSPATSGIVKIILPIIIVLVASGLGLVIPATYVDSKVNVPITALIALVAMHFVVSASLPQVGYLLMIDVVYLLAYATVTTMLAGAVVSAWTLKLRGEDEATALQRRFLVWANAAFLLSMAAVLVLYLRDLPDGSPL